MEAGSRSAARLAMAVLLVLPLFALARPAPPSDEDIEGAHEALYIRLSGATAGVPGRPGGGMGRLGTAAFYEGSEPSGLYGHSLLRGLSLSDGQREQVFAILHAQTTAVRTASKALRNAQDELRALSLSAIYDPVHARELADASSRAIAELAFLRANTEHQIWDVLTEEQRRQVEVIQQPKRSRL